MNKASHFDVLAADYDAVFTTSATGQAQRMVSRKWLLQQIDGKKNLNILELNCGTGEDAAWLAREGHMVIATDQSPAMIEQAQRRNYKGLSFAVCGFDEVYEQYQHQSFDLIFSNFAGLNCASTATLQALQLHSLLKPGGLLATVIFGKYCWWETGYYLSKLQASNAFRRWGNKEVSVRLANEVNQPIRYYSIKQFATAMAPLQLVQRKPIGLFIPPSYLEAAMQKRPRLFNSLTQLEQKIGNWSALSPLADHVFLLFKKPTP